MKRPEYLVVITGLSGSGKSYVQGTHENPSRVGIVVDVRTHDFARIFPTFYRERIRKLVPNVVLIFLEASDEVLARRYSETRRPHPMAHDLPILEAIQAERT